MMATFLLEILTPEKVFYSDQVETIVIKTVDGEMGILAGHEPTLAPVAIGTVRIKKDGNWLDAVLTEGFMQITNDKTIVLADTAEWPEEVDENRAKAAKERAEERLQSQLSRQEFIKSQAAVARAMARLKVKGKGH
ncbi:MAG: F0F1 ATP synthase subunit epsilon [Clostridia bacterium]|nr:F0F1 ATP synthase subunit epsilon [Clostridia bacterium]